MTYSTARGWAGLALPLLCIANFLDAMDVSTIGVALPEIQKELGMPASSLQWAVSAYVLGYGGFLLLGGRVADYFGHRRVFVWSLVVFALASIAGAFVDSALTLIAARLIKGIAAAFTAPAAISLLLSVFTEGKARARALGIYASSGGAGYTLGVVFGGAATLISWQATLIMGAPLAILALVITPLALPPDHKQSGPRARFDWMGAITITPGLLFFVFGVTNAAAVGWQAFQTWGSLVASLVLILLFLLVESRHSDPMVPLAMFRRVKLSHASVVAGGVQGTFVGYQFLATLYYQEVFGWSPFVTGLAFIIAGAVNMVLAPRFAVMAQARGTTKLMILGIGIQAIAYLIWGLGDDLIGRIALVVIPQVLIGVGYAMSYPAIQYAALSDIEEEKSGLASGMFFSAFQIGSGIILAVTSAVFGVGLRHGLNPYIAGSAFLTILMILIGLLAAVGPRTSAAMAAKYQLAE